jgi:hypothetical protein
MNTLDDLIKELDSPNPDLGAFDLGALSHAFSEARVRMRHCPEKQKRYYGSLIRRILELRAQRWRERSRQDLLKQIERTRKRIHGSDYELLHDRLYLQLLEKELAASDEADK